MMKEDINYVVGWLKSAPVGRAHNVGFNHRNGANDVVSLYTKQGNANDYPFMVSYQNYSGYTRFVTASTANEVGPALARIVNDEGTNIMVMKYVL